MPGECHRSTPMQPAPQPFAVRCHLDAAGAGPRWRQAGGSEASLWKTLTRKRVPIFYNENTMSERPPMPGSGSAFRPDNAATRQRLFARIRSATGRNAEESSTDGERALVNQRMTSEQRGPAPVSGSDQVGAFIARALALSCTVDQVASHDQVAAAVETYLTRAQLPRQVVVWPALKGHPSLPALESAGVAVRFGAPLGSDPVGFSAVACAVAETGTLVLASAPDTPASTHLLPETHIALLSTDQIVATLEEAFAHIKRQLPALPRALNLVSGPSRTGDIEQTIVLGAHGPYRVHLILVDAAA